MSSQFNNTSEQNDHQQVFSEDQFRAAFFDSSKRVMKSSNSTREESTHIKRARLDPTISIARKASVSGNSQPSTTVSSSVSSQSSNLSSAPHSQHQSTATLDMDMDLNMDVDVDSDVVVATSNVQHLTVDAVEGAVANATTNHHGHHLQMFDHEIVPSFVSTPTGCATPSSSSSSSSASSTMDVEESHSNSPSTSSSNIPSTSSNSIPKHQRKRSLKHTKIRKYRSRSLPNILFCSKSYDGLYSKACQDQSSASSRKPFDSLVSAVTDLSSTLNDSITSISSNPVSSSSSSSSSKFAFPPPALPPVNIQSLKEIDLSEIIKNPQLRHDILFDPQLQFRPNLDGERGRRKKITYDKYWNGVKEEIDQYTMKIHGFNERISRLPTLFLTLREILISLLPSKDKAMVMDVLDIELIMQQLVKNSLDFVSLAKWLSEIFKSHCAPMRDAWVDEMITKFTEADSQKSTVKLVEGLRMIFTILEAMKLDIANHQIRILRPVLIETAVEFERDYFLQMISRCKLDINDSIDWFKKHHQDSLLKTPDISPRQSSINSILSLLSCSHMISEFPSSLAFDHSRLIVLRANIRQLVCLNLCSALYRQLVCKHSSNNRQTLLSKKSMTNLKREILAIVTDDNGNVKWTRNIGSIALQIVRRALPNDTVPKDSIVEFGFNWLIKQTQPSSQVYSLMEDQTFNAIHMKIDELETSSSSSTTPSSIANNLNVNSADPFNLNSLIPMVSGNNNIINTAKSQSSSVNTSTSNSSKSSNDDDDQDEDDLNSISSRIALVCKFHWQVFGSYYTESLEK